MIYTTLVNFYLTAEQLEDSPSRQDGVTADDEFRARVYGCELIQEAGMLLKLPQVTMATGQVLLHRFYCKQSLAKRDVKLLSMACLFLATKLEETARKHREIISVFHRIERRREGRSLDHLDLYGNAYSEKKIHLVKAEKMILTHLGFILHVDHPHKDMLNYLHYLEASPSLMQVAWNLTNDSLRTTLCVRFKSKIVACGIIYTAARHLQEALPEDPPWWQVFSVDLADMCMVCREIFKLYHMEKAVYVNLGRKAGAMPDSNASPAPAQMTPAISTGHSGGDPAAPGSQGPSPETATDGKGARSAEGAASGRSEKRPTGRPASSDSAPARHADRDGSSRQQARHSSQPADRNSAPASSRDEDRRDKHREHRREGGRRDHGRPADAERESDRRRDRRSNKDSHHSRSRDVRSRDRDRDRLRSADGHASQRSRDRDRAHERPSQSRDGGAAGRSVRGPGTEPPRDNVKRQRTSGHRDADVGSQKKDSDSVPRSISSSEKGAKPSPGKSSASSSSQSTS